MERRVLLKLMAAGFFGSANVFGQHPGASAPAATAATPFFFSPEQLEAIDALADIIIPSDDYSGGARKAKVNLYIDVVVSESGERVQQQWLAGLKAVQGEAQNRFRKSFQAATLDQQRQIVEAMASNEDKPRTVLEKFFVAAKQTTVSGYYTSKVGIEEDLRYRGNTALSEFVGCTHPEHQG